MRLSRRFFGHKVREKAWRKSGKVPRQRSRGLAGNAGRAKEEEEAKNQFVLKLSGFGVFENSEKGRG